MPAPTLTTRRLTLRASTRHDYEDLHRLWSDPAVVRYITGTPSTREQSWMRLIRYAGFWDVVGYGQWSVVDRATGAYIGNCGIMDARREIVPEAPAGPEAGWVLAPAWHGKGLALEAMQAVLGWGDAQDHTRDSWCMITDGNSASVRLAEKLGYRFANAARYAGDDVSVYVRSRQSV